MVKIGDVIAGKYKVIEQVGKGGMSTVFLCRNEIANKNWALKEVRKTGRDDNDEVHKRNLTAEINTLKKIKHEHLPSIVDILENDETYLILMDYVEGISLDKILSHYGPQRSEDVINWMIQVCDAFDYLHNLDPPIIYRDTKPGNIMLNETTGNITIIDFGTTREFDLSDTNRDDTMALGTRGYAAPEQFGGMGHQSDARTDVYGIGTTMYHLLTGHNPKDPPYGIKPLREWDSSISSGLEKIVDRCTRDNPEERYQSVAELKYALENYKEFEDGSERIRKKRIILSGTLSIIGVCCLITSYIIGNMRDGLTAANYEAYMRAATTATTEDTRVANYEKAIKESPDTLEGYEKLLNSFLSDSIFSKSEAEELTSVLGYVPEFDSTSNEQAIKETDDYGQLCYMIGLAYYYYYEANGSPSMSEPWFNLALDAGNLTDNEYKRAEILSRIAQYYTQLNSVNKAGDAIVSYRDYFNDLKELCSSDIAGDDNVRTALITYKELSYQLSEHGMEFRNAGVKREEVQNLIDGVKERMLLDITYSDLSDSDRDLYDTVTSNFTRAEDMLNMTYGEG